MGPFKRPTCHAVVVVGLCVPLMLAAPRASAEPAETSFTFDLRLGGFIAGNQYRFAEAALGGVQFGLTHWFADSKVGLLFLVGPEGGYMSTGLGVLAATGEGGIVFSPSGNRTWSTTISVTWAPKVMLNIGAGSFGSGEVASPLGAEVAFNFSGFKFPLWFLETLDGTTFGGTSFGCSF